MANPTGKGGFQERPQDINREGAPKRDKQNWQATIKRITDMTRDEAIAYVGPRSKIAKLLKELPADLPIKDALVFISIIQYGRDPNPRLLAALMDREDGKPQQQLDVTSNGETITPKVDHERFDRAISSLADAVRESISGKGAKQDGGVGPTE
jgi:hypothetical protein